MLLIFQYSHTCTALCNPGLLSHIYICYSHPCRSTVLTPCTHMTPLARLARQVTRSAQPSSNQSDVERESLVGYSATQINEYSNYSAQIRAETSKGFGDTLELDLFRTLQAGLLNTTHHTHTDTAHSDTHTHTHTHTHTCSVILQ